MTTSTQWQLAQAAAERYEQVIVPSFIGPFARALVERAALRPGESVLDIGCGTGVAARLAALRVGPTGHVGGIDINSGMLAVARSLPVESGGSIEFREESAYQLSLPDGSIDAVLCAQVLQFLADRPLALAESRRVLKSGGRAAFSMWTSFSDFPYFGALVEAVTTHLGPGPAAGLTAAASLSNAEDIRTLLESAGFRNVELSVNQIDLDLPPMTEFVPRHLSATPLAPAFDAAPASVREALAAQVAGQLAEFAHADGCRVPFRSNLALGWK